MADSCNFSHSPLVLTGRLPINPPWPWDSHFDTLPSISETLSTTSTTCLACSSSFSLHVSSSPSQWPGRCVALTRPYRLLPMHLMQPPRRILSSQGSTRPSARWSLESSPLQPLVQSSPTLGSPGGGLHRNTWYFRPPGVFLLKKKVG